MGKHRQSDAVQKGVRSRRVRSPPAVTQWSSKVVRDMTDGPPAFVQAVRKPVWIHQQKSHVGVRFLPFSVEYVKPMRRCTAIMYPEGAFDLVYGAFMYTADRMSLVQVLPGPFTVNTTLAEGASG